MLDEPKLLVVDDEEAICEGCSRIFSRQGFQVEKCSDAALGLTKATQADYSAILLDIKMPGLDGIHFLELLRKEKPTIPVVLMTGYPSVPNAASAIRLGVSDYVTKPFTPEEISQAVHRLLRKNQGETEPAVRLPEPPIDKSGFRFYRNVWHQGLQEGAVRVGTLIVGPGVNSIESLRLPRIGEVVYQGLPLASVSVAGKAEQVLSAPLSGIVVAVNDALEQDPSALLNDPCGEGWIACISPTRMEDESRHCLPRRVILLTGNHETARVLAEKLHWLGCEVRSIIDPHDLDAIRKGFDSNVLLFDAAAFGNEGPGIVGEINAMNPEMRIVVLASSDSIIEPAYRIRRIFYYSVEPFADNEIADVLEAAFQPPPCPPVCQHREFAQVLNSISITNQNRTRVRLVVTPGLLRHEEGLGQLLRHKLMQKRFPLESSPSETQVTPMGLLSLATKCDRLIVLLAQDTGRLPGSLVRDTKAEYVALAGAGADRVTTLLVQPSGSELNPLGFDAATTEALADHLVREMATC